MNNNSGNNNTSGGITFTGALTLIFITLKLCNVIDWSWIWVLSPIWITASIGVLIIGIILVTVLIDRFKVKR